MEVFGSDDFPFQKRVKVMFPAVHFQGCIQGPKPIGSMYVIFNYIYH